MNIFIAIVLAGLVYSAYTALTGDTTCVFITGDGIGDDEVKIGDQRGSACVDACLAEKVMVGTINGATVYTDTKKKGCWCEINMQTRNSDGKYKSCFFGGMTDLNGDTRCSFITGKGVARVGSSTFHWMGYLRGSACVDACLEKKTTVGTINGVMVTADNKKRCWCVMNMQTRSSDEEYKSCFIGDAGLDGDSRCSFGVGDGVGGSEVQVGNQRGSACIDACVVRKRNDDTINGVTVFKDTSKGGCWCERKMTGRNLDSVYKSCFL